MKSSQPITPAGSTSDGPYTTSPAAQQPTTARGPTGNETRQLIDRLLTLTADALGDAPALQAGQLNQIADTMPAFRDALRTVLLDNVEELDRAWGLMSRNYRARVAIPADRAGYAVAHDDYDLAVGELAVAHDAAEELGDPLTRRISVGDVLKATRQCLEHRPALSLDEQHAQLRNYLNGVLDDLGGAAIPPWRTSPDGQHHHVAVPVGEGLYLVAADLAGQPVTYTVTFTTTGGAGLVTAGGVQTLAHQTIGARMPNATWRTVAALTSAQPLSDGPVLLQVWTPAGASWCREALLKAGYTVAPVGRAVGGNDLIVTRAPTQHHNSAEQGRRETADTVATAMSPRTRGEQRLGTFVDRTDVVDAIRRHHDDPGRTSAAAAADVAQQGFPCVTRALGRGRSRRPAESARRADSIQGRGMGHG